VPSLSLSLRVAQIRAAFSVKSTFIEKDAPNTPKLREVAMSPDDEILMTELTFDAKGITAYEISSVILVAEREQANPHGTFRCYMDHAAREFFIEIPSEETMHAFTQSALLNIMGLAEEAGADTCYVCVRNTVQNQSTYLRNFQFVGFEKLNEEELKTISMTKTHGILKCSLKSEEEDEEDY
jgi:hypothetical protein